MSQQASCCETVHTKDVKNNNTKLLMASRTSKKLLPSRSNAISQTPALAMLALALSTRSPQLSFGLHRSLGPSSIRVGLGSLVLCRQREYDIPSVAMQLADESHPVVDLRSDTVTKPTQNMRAAMAAAEVGDAVFGDDPTEQILESRIADLFGKEGALFVPTGTMANLIAVMANTWTRGAEYIVGDLAHIYIYEQGGGAQFGSAHPRAARTQPDGTLDLGELKNLVRAGDQHFPITQLICLENTHNMGGGLVLSTDYVKKVSELAHANNAKLHMDGARIWHAAVALGETLAQVAAPADTLSVCLSKALGAPAGSLVLGDKDFIAKARRLRKALGGTMRQTGVLAAAGLVALDDVLPNLGESHIRAKRLSEGLAALGFAVEPAPTNLVFFSCPDDVDAARLVSISAERGVRFLQISGSRMRAVLHHQISDAGVEMALAIIGEAMKESRVAPM